MAKWSDERREDPNPCREQDNGLFETTARDGRARLGRLHTAHGVLETPCLLPVINPNIRTIEPREMWDKYGIQAVITNSYVIWKHDFLRDKAQKDGVHALLDFPGTIMTDSGTFQSYIYGDVEVGVEEIVEFQASIGVDIATMLDIFTRPDMSFEEVSEAVDETISRGVTSIECAKGMMLNGPIQGGLFTELRQRSAKEMSNLDFAVHPIGGIVPIMEQQSYVELAKIILACKGELNPSKPVHLFGCGHPMLFPMAIALGADLFDSAAYALFARDGRLLCPWGTERIDELVEWPMIMPCVARHTPEEVRALDKDEKMKILAHYNLEMTLAELSRCRQAVREGKIWELAEKRSHQHPSLRDAWNYVLNLQSEWIIEAQQTPKTGGIAWMGDESALRPELVRARNRLIERWSPLHEGRVLVIHGAAGPWRERVGNLVARLKNVEKDLVILISTPIGLLPYSLEDLQPFAHIDGAGNVWQRQPLLDDLKIWKLEERELILLDLEGDELHERAFEALGLEPGDACAREIIWREQIVDKLRVLFNVKTEDAHAVMEGATFVKSKTGRVRNVMSSDGQHLFSPTLSHGGMSMTIEGAKWAHSLKSGLARVTVDDDAEPFIRKGRNVFHAFVETCDDSVRIGELCLVVNSQNELLGLGVAQCDAKEMLTFSKGIAVKVRAGNPPL